MKCPNCGASIFEGQFRCHHCNKIVESGKDFFCIEGSKKRTKNKESKKEDK